MFLVLFLCCTGDTTDSATPLIEEEYLPTIAKVTWEAGNSGNLVVSIQGPNRNLFDESTSNDNGVGTDYIFGIVESVGAAGPCEQENPYGCWTGEDCSGNAFVTPDGNTINNKCHDVYTVVSSDENIKTIEERFVYSNSVAAFLAQPSADSATTAFPNPDDEKYEFRVSYFLKDVQTGSCWAWGVDPDYFNEQNCDFPSRYQEDLSLPHTQILVLE